MSEYSNHTASTVSLSHIESPDYFYNAILAFLGFSLLFFIILAKAKGAAGLSSSPFLLVYTVLVTSFELSRIISAMFYNNLIHNKVRDQSELIQDEFEPTVTFVIPCKNEEKTIAKTIQKSFASNYPADKLEVIIINDGSTDNTISVLRDLQKEFPALIVIDWEINQGKRHGMAAGIREAKGEIIVQLDSDSYIEPDTFYEIIEPFRNKKIGAVCAHADPENADENFLTKMQAAYYFLSFRILKAAESTLYTVFCCSGCSSAYRKSLIEPILDEWLAEKFLGLPVTWGDDRALTNWVLRQGYKTIYTDRTQAYTICPNNFKQLMKQQIRWKKGWFVNSIFASKFIWKEQPFVAFTYFFPLIFITLITPFMASKALLYNTIVEGNSPILYVSGIFLVAALVTIYYRYIARKNKYWPYVFAWSALNMVVLSFVLFYAIGTIQNRKWGTR
ncbi:MAG: glycosyltransferase [Patescibacteria group bacterium]